MPCRSHKAAHMRGRWRRAYRQVKCHWLIITVCRNGLNTNHLSNERAFACKAELGMVTCLKRGAHCRERRMGDLNLAVCPGIADVDEGRM